MRRTLSLAVSLLVLAVGCSQPLTQRTVDVDFLWVKTEGGRPTAHGGTTRARVTLSPNPGDDIRVGVLEESPGSIGEMWRAAVWLSAVMSALSTGQELSASKITVEANGLIDGPSAGSLMTAAMMSARLGHETRGDVTITGTVNPDGSIGPVGGLPLKVMAAIREGKKRIGYPMGQGLAHDHVTGRMVNLVELARQQGAEALEVSDIHAAYALLTGRELERPEALPIREMRLPADLRKGLKHRATAWIARAERAYRAVRVPPVPTLQARWEATLKRVEEARRYLSRGDFAAAYWHAVGAAIDAEATAALTQFAAMAPRQDIRAAVDILSRLTPHVDQRFRAFASRVRHRDTRTVDNTLRELDALEAAVASAVYLQEAAAGYRVAIERARAELARPGGRSPERVAALLAQLQRPVHALIVADANIQIAADTLDFDVATRRTVDVGPRQRDQLTKLFTRAAQANLHYFESIHLAQLARTRGISREAAMKQFASSDRAYLSARAHLGFRDIAALGDGTTAQKLARLAGALSSFFNSSSLIARYESLQIQVDPTSGAPTKVGRERVFWRMLALAERKAREHAATAKQELGRVPTPALIAYHIGRVYQERPALTDKLNALEQFWRASVWSQLAALMASAD